MSRGASGLKSQRYERKCRDSRVSCWLFARGKRRCDEAKNPGDCIRISILQARAVACRGSVAETWSRIQIHCLGFGRYEIAGSWAFGVGNSFDLVPSNSTSLRRREYRHDDN